MSSADGDERSGRQNLAGWPSQGDPDDDPVATVRVHPADKLHDPGARRVIKTSTGGWVRLTQPAIPPQAERGTELHTWPHQSLEHLARALDHSDADRAVRSGQVPNFWNAAKVYCRALGHLSGLYEELHERYRAVAGE